MRKEIAIELIKDFHEKPIPNIINRELEIKLPKIKKAITIIGPRRAGKTFFLFNIMERLGIVKRTEIFYINLEDDRLLPLELKDLDRILRTYYEIYPKNRKNKGAIRPSTIFSEMVSTAPLTISSSSSSAVSRLTIQPSHFLADLISPFCKLL